MTHYRYSRRYTACGKPHNPHRTRARRFRPVTKMLEDVTCRACVEALAKRSEYALKDEVWDPAPGKMRILSPKKHVPPLHYFNISPSGKVYTGRVPVS